MSSQERAVADSLDHFDRALAEGRRTAAYDSLLSAWRTQRAPELAALLDRAAGLFGSAPEPEKSLKNFQAAWLDAARSRRRYDSRALLEALEPLVATRKGSNMAACLDELRMIEGDPTLALVACRFAAMPGGTVNFGAWGKVLTRLFAIIECAGDPRAIEPLEALLAAASGDPKEDYEMSSRTPSTNEALAKRIPRAIEALRRYQHAPLSNDLRERARSILARLDQPLPAASSETTGAATSQDDLFAQVIAHPEDNAPRAVWADALQQAGDPRGELVALQLAGSKDAKAQRAIEKLVTKHWKAWLGPLAPAVVRSSLVFDRGLLHACTTDVRRKGTAAAVFSHPSWGTVRTLEFKQYGMLTPAMTQLEIAIGVPEAGLEGLKTIVLPRLRSLEVVPNPSSSYEDGLSNGNAVGRGMKALLSSKGLPALEALSLRLNTREYDGNFVDRVASHYRCVFEAPCARQLTTLRVNAAWSSGFAPPARQPDWLRRWVEAARKHLPALRQLVLVDSSGLVVNVPSGNATVELDLDPSVASSGLPPWARGHVEAARAIVQSSGLSWSGP